MRKILGMSLVVVLSLGVGSYALGHGSSADGQSTAVSGGMMGQGMMGMGRSMMTGGTNFIDVCRTMMTRWLGTTDSSAPEDPYSRKGPGGSGSRQ